VDVIKNELFALNQLVQIVPERGEVLRKLLRAFFEGHEYPGFVILPRPLHQKFHAEERLAASCTARYQRRPSFRQSAARNLIEPLDPGGTFRQLHSQMPLLFRFGRQGSPPRNNFSELHQCRSHSAPVQTPSMMVSLLLYAYSFGIRSSREIEKLCERDIGFKVVAANQVPDHYTIN
jgi:Transposase domain (DUF772)